MMNKKICLLGTSYVGKTSLVQRYITNAFDDKYQTTLGIKIDKKIVKLEEESIQMTIWDIEGQDRFKPLNINYLKGASGVFIVVDSTRANSLLKTIELEANVKQGGNDIPIILLLNKVDLTDEWSLPNDELEHLKTRGWQIIKTSAKTGLNVEFAFESLARAMLVK